MPQFDFTKYSAQIFWFAICFICLYFFLAKIILPRIRAIIEERKSKIDGDLNLAKSFESSIEELREKSEQLLEDAGVKQKAAIDEVVKQSIVKREKALEEFRDKSAKLLEKSKEEIASFVAKSQDKNRKVIEELT